MSNRFLLARRDGDSLVYVGRGGLVRAIVSNHEGRHYAEVVSSLAGVSLDRSCCRCTKNWPRGSTEIDALGCPNSFAGILLVALAPHDTQKISWGVRQVVPVVENDSPHHSCPTSLIVRSIAGFTREARFSVFVTFLVIAASLPSRPGSLDEAPAA
jgi:hypothetical protein